MGKENLIQLVEKWQKDQCNYEHQAEKCKKAEDFVNERRYTYKAQATRDCWKELHKLISKE